MIPVKARKEAGISQGDVLSVEPAGDGRIILVRLNKPKSPPPCQAMLLPRKGRHPVLVGAPRVTSDQVKKILGDDFP